MELRKIIDDPMSDYDIRLYLGKNAKIITYDELKNYKTIDDIMPNHKDFVVILFREDTEGHNHWIGMTKDKSKNAVYHFCSYGSYPDEYLFTWINCKMRKKLGEDRAYMTDLLNSCVYDVFYNDIKYQLMEYKGDDNIATCGRHLTNFIINFIDNGMDLKKYYEYMRGLQQKQKKTYDAIVSELVDVYSP